MLLSAASRPKMLRKILKLYCYLMILSAYVQESKKTIMQGNCDIKGSSGEDKRKIGIKMKSFRDHIARIHGVLGTEVTMRHATKILAWRSCATELASLAPLYYIGLNLTIFTQYLALGSPMYSLI